jgi:3-methyladenine DNA glycosylase AlkD
LADLILSDLQALFVENADVDRAPAMKRYMRDQFPFLGIASPIRKQLQNSLFSTLPLSFNPVPLSSKLWQLPEREYQYAACDLLTKCFRRKKAMENTDADLLLSLILHRKDSSEFFVQKSSRLGFERILKN